jgi:glutathione synthase/RimK-type ligase-like ATP-grasp enzyme
MRLIALATSSKHPALADDDRLLLEPLAERGFASEPAIWDDPAVDWKKFVAVVIRSCWDYHLRAEAFLRWIASLEQARVALWNSAALVRWNANQSYLRDLDTKGILLVPTFWPETADRVSLQERLRELGWTQAVVKPRVSATAHRTQRVTIDDAGRAQELFNELRSGVGVMLQKFMDSIVREGEWSLIFFGGRFSHAIMKTPKPGDFRVQNDFGGSAQPVDPPSSALQAATRILQTIEPTVYAR